MNSILNLVLVEFPTIWENTDGNLSHLNEIFHEIFTSGEIPAADIVVLPEFFSTGFTMNPNVAENVGDSPSLKWLTDMSVKYGCAVAGSVPVLEKNGARYNRFYFVKPCGSVEYYDKKHPFMGGEDINYSPGESKVDVEWKGWRIRLNVCFDLRFPKWCRNSGTEPYDLYLNVANWPSSRMKAASTLIAARAIENVSYAAFCNRSGSDPILEYGHFSDIVNHRGRSRGVRTQILDTQVIHASLDKEEMYRFREGFPILELIDE